MLRKIVVIDIILVTVFFMVNYLFLVLKIYFISSIYFVFVTTLQTEVVFPFAIFSLLIIPFVKRFKLFYTALNIIIIYLLFWLVFLIVVNMGIGRYGV